MIIARPNLWFHKENEKISLAKPQTAGAIQSRSTYFYIEISMIHRNNKVKLSLIDEIHKNKSHENIIQLWFQWNFDGKKAQNYDNQIIKVIIE